MSELDVIKDALTGWPNYIDNLTAEAQDGLEAVKQIENVLTQTRDFFVNEVEAGDDSLQVWVNKLDSLLT